MTIPLSLACVNAAVILQYWYAFICPSFYKNYFISIFSGLSRDAFCSFGSNECRVYSLMFVCEVKRHQAMNHRKVCGFSNNTNRLRWKLLQWLYNHNCIFLFSTNHKMTLNVEGVDKIMETPSIRNLVTTLQNSVSMRIEDRTSRWLA